MIEPKNTHATNLPNVLDFDDYRAFLQSRVGHSRARNGERVKIANFIRVHPSFITLVLQNRADLSLEAAEHLNRLYGHTDDEGEYFLNLVLRARAGTQELQGRLDRRLRAIREEARKKAEPGASISRFPKEGAYLD